ncbi:unnamed protein product [marine sediment metagenome]|uniref:Uncharacterized protein n=1 Tax=marine sediment metagenome TaxID=412755 RepID=X0S9J7_9ZZZZ
MAKCRWCEKELPSNNEAVNSCGSCLFRSLDEVVETSEDGDTNPEGVKINYDMSGLGKEKSRTKGKEAGTLKRDLFLNSMKPSTPSNQEILMKRVKVKSNSIRGKVLVVGDSLVLSFDEKGIAECFASDVPVITAYNRVRPGRISIVEAPKAAPAPALKKVEKKAAAKVEKVEVKKEDKPETKPRVEKKKAPKKSFFKKDAE